MEEVFDILKAALGDRISRFNISGSMSKRTEIKGLSDVDVQLTIGGEYSGYTPLEVRRILKKVLQNKLNDVRIRNGDIALTLRFKDIDVQLIPVIPVGKGKVKVPTNNLSWSGPTDQQFFRNELNNLYDSYQRDPRDNIPRVQKVIKFMKVLESRRPVDMRLPGYYIENIVYNALKNGQCKPNATSPVLLKHCYEYASKQILKKTTELSGQTKYVDSCLNSKQANNRLKISQQMSKTAE